MYESFILIVPTTNNHCESNHTRINSIATDKRYSIKNRITLVVDHIMSRLVHFEASSIANLRYYMSDLSKRATEKIDKNTDLLPNYSLGKCDCKYLTYYSMFYNIDL